MAIVHLSFLCVLACESPDMADIVENAHGIALVTIVETRPLAGTAVPGMAIAADVEEPVWGSVPEVLFLWAPVSACDRIPRSGEFVVGFRDPPELERDHLRIPRSHLVLCGAEPARDGLPGAVRRLRQAQDVDALVPLLAEAEPVVRRQAVRQLGERLCDGAGVATLGRVLPLASEEDDPIVLHAYIAAFGHFRYGEAAPIVTRALLRNESEVVAGAAETAFARIARPSDIAQVLAAYPAVDLPVKARILAACARVPGPETQRLLRSALTAEETILPALEAMVAAGRPVPAEVPRVRDPLRARRIGLFMSRLQSRNMSSFHAGTH